MIVFAPAPFAHDGDNEITGTEKQMLDELRLRKIVGPWGRSRSR
ncbi:hypothetical protein QF035_008926 [Streptomyces umbrinus]|uniref:Uncharacterized protein n=1 Tax=Streptomyces umbrinus TaxID=67370 RepID=A0ABU0T948_9ACTN|nr:hypothetical protein [Streptomyces umbrinus]MDQ1031344.1 hypothetical protein [Streptomyces umbrinus]